MKFDYDNYKEYSQFLPTIILLIPIITEITVLLYALEAKYIIVGITPVGIFVILMLALMPRVIHRGKNLEDKLFKKWGGMPSTRFLRRDNKEYKNSKYVRDLLFKVITQCEKPKKNDEEKSREKADVLYENAVVALRNKTRDKCKYNVLYEANKKYGFLRNLLGVKWFAIITSVVFIILNVIMNCKINIICDANILVGQNIILIIYIVFMLFVVNEQILKDTADNYAIRLFETLNILYDTNIENEKG